MLREGAGRPVSTPAPGFRGSGPHPRARTRQKRARVRAPLHKRVRRFAVGLHRGGDDGAAAVLEHRRRRNWLCAARHRVLKHRARVRHGKGNVLHAVTVASHVRAHVGAQQLVALGV